MLRQAGGPVLTGRGDEPVGDEHEGPVGERDVFGQRQVLVEDAPEAQLIEQGPNDEDRPPVRGFAELGVGEITILAGEEPPELGEHIEEEVLSSEIGDNALFDLTAFAVGLDDTDVFVDGAAFGADFDGSRVHENHYHDGSWRIKVIFRANPRNSDSSCHYAFGPDTVEERKQGLTSRERYDPKHGIVLTS